MKKIKALSYKGYLAVILIGMINSCPAQEIKLETTPSVTLEKMIHNPAFVENPNGEDFCWNARVGLDQFVDNYILTKDTKWLDAGVKYYDFLIGKMITDPDGYNGWIGAYEYNDKYWQDALVGDAILFEGILNFSVLVLEDQSLKNKYKDKAMSYVEQAKRNFFEKFLGSFFTVILLYLNQVSGENKLMMYLYMVETMSMDY